MTSTEKNLNKSSSNSYPLVKINGLKKYFPVNKGFVEELFGSEEKNVHAVDDVDVAIDKNEVYCIVGESGCGKTTLARVVSGLDKPTDGTLIWKGDEIGFDELKPSKDDVKTQFVFQDPYSSLSPRMMVGEAVQHPLVLQDQISDDRVKNNLKNAKYSEIALVTSFFLLLAGYVATFALDTIFAVFAMAIGAISFLAGMGAYFKYNLADKHAVKDPDVISLLEKVGLSPAEQYYEKYPHELSGGERQRVNIARSIILNPDLLILDEPTSMLDVSLRAGILKLLGDLQQEFDITILFITHDLATALHFSDRIGVMYVGEIVETGTTNEIFDNPAHPYTKALIDAIPSPSKRDSMIELPTGDVPSAIDPPNGCRFHPRCPIAEDKCSQIKPKLQEISSGHEVACHFPLIDADQ